VDKLVTAARDVRLVRDSLASIGRGPLGEAAPGLGCIVALHHRSRAIV
jgi:hypothetical protein